MDSGMGVRERILQKNKDTIKTVVFNDNFLRKQVQWLRSATSRSFGFKVINDVFLNP